MGPANLSPFKKRKSDIFSSRSTTTYRPHSSYVELIAYSVEALPSPLCTSSLSKVHAHCDRPKFFINCVLWILPQRSPSSEPNVLSCVSSVLFLGCLKIRRDDQRHRQACIFLLPLFDKLKTTATATTTTTKTYHLGQTQIDGICRAWQNHHRASKE